MAQACAELIYGIPLHLITDPWAPLPSLLNDVFQADELVEGFIKPYSGNDQSYAFGMRMNIDIDSSDLFTEVTKLDFNVTDSEKRYFVSIFAKLSPELQAEVSKFGEPRVFFLWGTT
jgi:hypothetical protein